MNFDEIEDFDVDVLPKNKDSEYIEIEKKDNITNYFYIFEDKNDKYQLIDKKFKNKKNKVLLTEIDEATEKCRIFPLNTIPMSRGFLESKYSNIKEIIFEGYSIRFEGGTSDFSFYGLPDVFIRDLLYGLGFLKKYKAIINSLQSKLPSTKTLIISELRPTQALNDSFVISDKDLRNIQKGIDRITSNYNNESLKDRLMFSYNSLLYTLDPIKFPELKKPIRKDIIYKIVKSYDFKKSKLSEVDKSSLLELKESVDLSYLSALIKEFKEIIDKNSKEEIYQVFFKSNPLLLTLLSSSPYVLFKEKAYVGGKSFDNRNGNFPDFLLKHKSINNTFIIEIKRPDTKLLENEHYREGVYAPSKELSGAITQAITQKYNLETNIASLTHASEDRNVEAYNVQCLIIAGLITKLDSPHKKRSFELFRNSQKNVKIITYDECLELLNTLSEILSKNIIAKYSYHRAT